MAISREKVMFWVNVLGLVFIVMGFIDFFFIKSRIKLALAEYVLGAVLIAVYFFLKARTTKREHGK